MSKFTTMIEISNIVWTSWRAYRVSWKAIKKRIAVIQTSKSHRWPFQSKLKTSRNEDVNKEYFYIAFMWSLKERELSKIITRFLNIQNRWWQSHPNWQDLQQVTIEGEPTKTTLVFLWLIFCKLKKSHYMIR